MGGGKEYFRLAETPKVLATLDEWIRHRGCECFASASGKRGTTAFRELRARGISQHAAAMTARFTQNWWRASASKAMQIALPMSYFDGLGVPRLAG